MDRKKANFRAALQAAYMLGDMRNFSQKRQNTL